MKPVDEPKKEMVIGHDYFHIQSSCVVKLREIFTIHTKNGSIDLDVDITADMIKIPEEYREIFMNMLTAKYLNRVSACDSNVFKNKNEKELPWWKKKILKWLNQ